MKSFQVYRPKLSDGERKGKQVIWGRHRLAVWSLLACFRVMRYVGTEPTRAPNLNRTYSASPSGLFCPVISQCAPFHAGSYREAPKLDFLLLYGTLHPFSPFKVESAVKDGEVRL